MKTLLAILLTVSSLSMIPTSQVKAEEIIIIEEGGHHRHCNNYYSDEYYHSDEYYRHHSHRRHQVEFFGDFGSHFRR